MLFLMCFYSPADPFAISSIVTGPKQKRISGETAFTQFQRYAKMPECRLQIFPYLLHFLQTGSGSATGKGRLPLQELLEDVSVCHRIVCIREAVGLVLDA